MSTDSLTELAERIRKKYGERTVKMLILGYCDPHASRDQASLALVPVNRRQALSDHMKRVLGEATRDQERITITASRRQWSIFIKYIDKLESSYIDDENDDEDLPEEFEDLQDDIKRKIA